MCTTGPLSGVQFVPGVDAFAYTGSCFMGGPVPCSLGGVLQPLWRTVTFHVGLLHWRSEPPGTSAGPALTGIPLTLPAPMGAAPVRVLLLLANRRPLSTLASARFHTGGYMPATDWWYPGLLSYLVAPRTTAALSVDLREPTSTHWSIPVLASTIPLRAH